MLIYYLKSNSSGFEEVQIGKPVHWFISLFTRSKLRTFERTTTGWRHKSSGVLATCQERIAIAYALADLKELT